MSRAMLKPYLLGHDVEYFVTGRDGTVAPPHEWFPLEPPPVRQYHIPSTCKHPVATTFVDGLQAEMNMMATSCREEVIMYTQTGIRDAFTDLPIGYDLRAIPVVRCDPKALRDVPKAYEWGCNPIENAYHEELPPPNLRKLPLRFAGGHMHFSLSYHTETGFDPWDFTQWLDRTVGVIAVALSAKQHKLERLRRKYCGRAGDFRVGPCKPDYKPPSMEYVRMEYRTPSNFWVTNTWLMHVMYGALQQALRTYHITDRTGLQTDADIQGIINDVDVPKARREALRVAKWWVNGAGHYNPEMEFSPEMPKAFNAVLMQLLKDAPMIEPSLRGMSRPRAGQGYIFTVRMLLAELRDNQTRRSVYNVAQALREGWVTA